MRPNSRRLAVCVAALAIAVALAGACGGGGRPAPTASLPASPDALPSFDLAGFRQLLSQLHGRYVVVNIWGSWCAPCIAEAPHLSAVARETEGKVQFLGIDILDQRPPARSFIHKYGWIYPSVFDPSGSIRDGLGLLGQPHTLVYDPQGRQVWVYSGPVPGEMLRLELKTLGAI